MRLEASGDSSSCLAAVISSVLVAVGSISGNVNRLGVTNSTSMSDSSCPLPRPKFPTAQAKIPHYWEAIVQRIRLCLARNDQLFNIAW